MTTYEFWWNYIQVGKPLGRKLSRKLGQKLGRKLGQKLGRKLGRKLSGNLGRKLSQRLGRKLGQKLGRKLCGKLGRKLGRKLDAKLGRTLGQTLDRKLMVGNLVGSLVGHSGSRQVDVSANLPRHFTMFHLEIIYHLLLTILSAMQQNPFVSSTLLASVQLLTTSLTMHRLLCSLRAPMGF